MTEDGVTRRLAAILAADVAGYTRLMEADENATIGAWKAARQDVIDPKVAEYQGRIVKHTGDGFLAEFGSVTDAVNCAIDMQKLLAARSADTPGDRRMNFRMGINLGDIIEELDDIHGDGVNIAARLEGLAEPGGICVSISVYEQVRKRVDLGFEDLGSQKVKNIAEPVRAYRVVLDPEATGTREAPQVAIATRVHEAKRVLTICSGTQRQGTWRVPKKLRVVTVMGGTDLDFREAEFGPGVTEVKVTIVMGGIAIIVPPHLQVECDGGGILGLFEGMERSAGKRDSGAPLLRITGVAVMGALEISTRLPGEMMKVDASASVGQIGRR